MAHARSTGKLARELDVDERVVYLSNHSERVFAATAIPRHLPGYEADVVCQITGKSGVQLLGRPSHRRWCRHICSR